MPLRIIEVVAEDKAVPAIRQTAEEFKALRCWELASRLPEGPSVVRILSELDGQQDLLDALQDRLSAYRGWQIVLLSVEATIPHPAKAKKAAEKEAQANGEEPKAEAKRRSQQTASREELYTEIGKGVRLDTNYFLFVILSTIVAAIGLLEDNVAVVIGAMVIAPLLGPNLAFAFGAALGDRSLMLQAARVNIIGLMVALAISVGLGVVMPLDLTSDELLSRTTVGYESVALALASGAAAVLSMTTGLSSALVGVMVAVALLPPTATLGFMIGSGDWDRAWGAFLLLSVNIVSVNLAAQLVFLRQGVSPWRWYEKARAKQSARVNLFFWMVLLALSLGLIAVAGPEAR